MEILGRHEGIEEVSNWLTAFHDHHPFYWEGDDLATTYSTTAAVLLAACRLDTTSAALVAAVTGLPNSFVALIVQRMDRSRYRAPTLFVSWGTPFACEHKTSWR